jgi:hypothetical protein
MLSLRLRDRNVSACGSAAGAVRNDIIFTRAADPWMPERHIDSWLVLGAVAQPFAALRGLSPDPPSAARAESPDSAASRK